MLTKKVTVLSVALMLSATATSVQADWSFSGFKERIFGKKTTVQKEEAPLVKETELKDVNVNKNTNVDQEDIFSDEIFSTEKEVNATLKKENEEKALVLYNEKLDPSVKVEEINKNFSLNALVTENHFEAPKDVKEVLDEIKEEKKEEEEKKSSWFSTIKKVYYNETLRGVFKIGNTLYTRKDELDKRKLILQTAKEAYKNLPLWRKITGCTGNVGTDLDDAQEKHDELKDSEGIKKFDKKTEKNFDLTLGKLDLFVNLGTFGYNVYYAYQSGSYKNLSDYVLTGIEETTYFDNYIENKIENALRGVVGTVATAYFGPAFSWYVTEFATITLEKTGATKTITSNGAWAIKKSVGLGLKGANYLYNYYYTTNDSTTNDSKELVPVVAAV